MTHATDVPAFDSEEKLDWTAEERDEVLAALDQLILEMCQKEHPSELEKMLTEKLSPRSLKILLYRSGFFDGHLHTLRETGLLFGVSSERIRQTEGCALQRLRKRPHRRKRLVDYLND